jgi:hypothetical protein
MLCSVLCALCFWKPSVENIECGRSFIDKRYAIPLIEYGSHFSAAKAAMFEDESGLEICKDCFFSESERVKLIRLLID